MYPTSFAQLFLRLSNINEKWNEILPSFHITQYKKGREIQTTSDYLLFLEKGIIKTSFITFSGLEWIFIFQKQGCLFNELAIFNNKIKFQYTAHTDIIIRQIPRSFIESIEFIQNYPELYVNFIETLALKESISYSYFSDLAYASAKSRVCQALLALLKGQNAKDFNPELTQAEIGAMMGLHQTTVARVIKELRQENIIGTFTKKKLQIYDIEKLEEISKNEQEPLIFDCN